MGVKVLGKIKIHEIAKKLDLTSKEVLEVANKLKIDAKSHLSSVEEDEAKKIENALSKNNKDKPVNDKKVGQSVEKKKEANKEERNDVKVEF